MRLWVVVCVGILSQCGGQNMYRPGQLIMPGDSMKPYSEMEGNQHSPRDTQSRFGPDDHEDYPLYGFDATLTKLNKWDAFAKKAKEQQSRIKGTKATPEEQKSQIKELGQWIKKLKQEKVKEETKKKEVLAHPFAQGIERMGTPSLGMDAYWGGSRPNTITGLMPSDSNQKIEKKRVRHGERMNKYVNTANRVSVHEVMQMAFIEIERHIKSKQGNSTTPPPEALRLGKLNTLAKLTDVGMPQNYGGPQNSRFPMPLQRDYGRPPNNKRGRMPPMQDYGGPSDMRGRMPPMQDYGGSPNMGGSMPPMQDYGGPPNTRGPMPPMQDYEGPPNMRGPMPPMQDYGGPTDMEGPNPSQPDYGGPPNLRGPMPFKQGYGGPPNEFREPPYVPDREGGNIVADQLSMLPEKDDFNSPIMWVPLTSAKTEDGLAKVTDLKTGRNWQALINNTMFVPIIDNRPKTLGITEESTTMFPLTTPDNGALDALLNNMDPKDLKRGDWLGFDAALNKATAPQRCSEDGCLSRCNKPSCQTMCRGDTCTSGCIGAGCSTFCDGSGCRNMCIGNGCIAQCKGEACESKCRGENCRAKCRSFSCSYVTNGVFRTGGGSWDQHYPDHPRLGPPNRTDYGPDSGEDYE